MKTFYVILGGVFIIWAYFSCLASNSFDSPESKAAQNYMTVVEEKAADGLDLEALLDVIAEAESGEDLEKRLNVKDGVNNLDLNNDGDVDYLKVTEFGDKDSYGFSLTTEPEKGQVQEVATIKINRGAEEAEVQVAGNPQIYGNNHYYRSSFGVTDWLLLAYLMRPHPYYVSPWYYGHYPSYYRPYRPYTSSKYRSRISTWKNDRKKRYSNSSYVGGRYTGARRVGQPMATTITSPNKGKVAKSGIRKTLSKPTTAQKSFRTREASKTVRSGGFGRNSSSSNSSRSVRGSSSRGFGGRGK